MQHIFEAEVLPYALALLLWADLLTDCCVFAFIDNEAAKASWIAGYANSPVASAIIHHGTVLEADNCVAPFFVRVPTTSNMGDDPSRGHFHLLEQFGARRTMVTDETILKLCTLDFSTRPS